MELKTEILTRAHERGDGTEKSPHTGRAKPTLWRSSLKIFVAGGRALRHRCHSTSANDGGGANPFPKLFATVIIIIAYVIGSRGRGVEAVGTVEGIYIAEKAGAPMLSLDRAEVLTQRGIKGDRYAARRGTYSVFRMLAKMPGKREPGHGRSSTW